MEIWNMENMEIKTNKTKIINIKITETNSLNCI